MRFYVTAPKIPVQNKQSLPLSCFSILPLSLISVLAKIHFVLDSFYVGFRQLKSTLVSKCRQESATFKEIWKSKSIWIPSGIVPSRNLPSWQCREVFANLLPGFDEQQGRIMVAEVCVNGSCLVWKFRKREQALASFVSRESSGFKQYFTGRKRGQLEDKLDNLQKLTTRFQKCSQSYLNLSLCFLLRQLLGQLSTLLLRQY